MTRNSVVGDMFLYQHYFEQLQVFYIFTNQCLQSLKHKDSFGKEKNKKNKTCSIFDKTLSKVFLDNFHALNRSQINDLIIITPCKVQLITCIDLFGGPPNNSKNNSNKKNIGLYKKRDSEQTITAR